MTSTTHTRTFRLTSMALLTAFGVLLAGVIHVPLIPIAPFLEYDPADIAILIGSFLYGPLAGLGLTASVSIVQGITVSASGGFLGILMHFIATGTFCFLASLIYLKRHTISGMILGLVIGGIAQTILMCLWNLIITPIFLGSSLEEVIALLLPAIIPFNLIKVTLNGIGAMLIYPTICKFLSNKGLDK